MGCQTIPPSSLPHQTKLFLHYLEQFGGVADFYAHPPTFEAAVRVAEALEFPEERRSAIAEILKEQNAGWGAGPDVERNLDRLGRGAATVVSGQQVGLFSGPAYAVYKALTAVQVAEELTQHGIHAVPVFWMATEDHDLEEVRHATWFSEGQLHRFELPSGSTGGAVGEMPLGPEINELSRQAAELLHGPGGERLGNLLRKSYAPGETYGSAFAKLFTQLFAGRGLILLDPIDARLHKIAAPVYRQALEQRDELNDKLLERGKDLEKKGYAAQVKVTERSTLLFRMDKQSRQVINADNNGTGSRFKSGNTVWTRDELTKLIESEPEKFSPNALLRPVVQDYLLPTVACIAGPSEIAYYAQSEVVYRHVLGRMPVILPRADFTLVDPKAARVLKRYDLSVEQLWEGPQKLQQRMEGATVPKVLLREFERNQALIEKSLLKLTEKIEKLDPTLQGAIELSRKKMEFQLEKVKRKTGEAIDRKTGLIAEHRKFLEAELFPNKELQSRELCFLTFLSRWGTGLDELQKLSGSKYLGKHYVVSIP
ncbi:MAG TPA: bacillithiol biosynthesis cysteine-adding enzyme BshC [Candidatus Dormibacteraeota bacterium]|nr:bacillithiol biosynthesis cysteine-adding enzyme BshC [Candidatus Dormibacteraeota bacterium]